MMLEAIIIALGLVQSAWGLQVNLHHRLLVPSNGQPAPFVLKGFVELDNVVGSEIHTTYNPSDSGWNSLITSLKHVETPSALYQVALEVPGVSQDSWPFSSVDACHLPSANGEHISLHTSPGSLNPSSIDYWLANAPDNGACPSSASNYGAQLDVSNWNTTIVTRTPTLTPTVYLRMPLPVNPDGKPVEPQAEQSFISKYWMYLVGGFIVLTFIIPAPEEEAPKAS